MSKGDCQMSLKDKILIPVGILILIFVVSMIFDTFLNTGLITENSIGYGFVSFVAGFFRLMVELLA